jgi:hypothetical protein
MTRTKYNRYPRRMHHSQKMWMMKGCSGKKSGGAVNPYLAFTGQPNHVPVEQNLAFTGKSGGGNPNFAYTGQKGGCGGTCGLTPPMSGGGNPNFAYTGQKGGCGGTCGLTPPMSGGSSVPFPLSTVGGPQGWSAYNTPGLNSAHSGDYYSLNSYKNQPDYSPDIQERIGGSKKHLIFGGKPRKSRKISKVKKYRRTGKRRGSKRKGGGISGIGSLAYADLGNAYHTITGHATGPSPLPYLDQFGRQDNLAYLQR